MSSRRISTAPIACVIGLALAGCANGTAPGNAGSSGIGPQAGADGTGASAANATDVTSADAVKATGLDTADMFSDRDTSGDYDVDATHVTLADGASESDGDGAEVDGNVIRVTEEGTYVLKGSLADGQIAVDADGAKVQLVLDGVSIDNETLPGIYVKEADKVFVTSAAGSENSIDVGEASQDDDEDADAAVFSHDDLTLNGTGALSVTSASRGIKSSDDLKVVGTGLTVKATGQGLRGNDSVRIASGDIRITSDDDGMHADSSDKAAGYVYIGGGSVTIDSGDDGIHADGAVLVNGGKVTVTGSYEGIEGQVVGIAAGDVDVTSDDDGINAASGSNGEADGGMAPRGGMPGPGRDTDQTRDGNAMPEAPEDANGNAPENAPEDANGNAPEDAPEPPQGDGAPDGRGAGNAPKYGGGAGMMGMDTDEDAAIVISGGNVTVSADGDGLDSNGYIRVSGGETHVYGPTRDGNGSLDYGITAEISGGTVVAAGSSGMAETFSDDSEQASLMVGIAGDAGDTITVTDPDGKQIVRDTARKAYSCVIVSTPDLKEGETYTVSNGDDDVDVRLDSKSTRSGVAESGMGGMGGGGMRGTRGGSQQGGSRQDAEQDAGNGTETDGNWTETDGNGTETV